MNRVVLLSLLLCTALLAQQIPAAAGAQGKAATSAALCQDVQPPGSNFTCSDQYSFGKCNAPWMVGYCDLTCERCCTDEQPPSPENFTCADQLKFGACEKVWMQKHNWCQITCSRCHAAGYAIPPSTLPSETSGADPIAAGGVTTAAAPAPGSPNPPSTDVAAQTDAATGAAKDAAAPQEAPAGATPLTDAQKAEIAAGGTMEPDKTNLSWIAGIVVAVVVVGAFMGGTILYLQAQKHKRFQTLEDTEVAMSARGF